MNDTSSRPREGWQATEESPAWVGSFAERAQAGEQRKRASRASGTSAGLRPSPFRLSAATRNIGAMDRGPGETATVLCCGLGQGKQPGPQSS